MKNPIKDQFIMGTQWGLFLLLAICSFIKPYTFKMILKPYGLALIIVGFTTMMLANIAHGSINNKVTLTAYSEPNPNAKLVQKGIYSYIRHPIYLAFICISFGTSFCIGNLYSIVIAILSLLFYYFKSNYEEKKLIKVYPEYTAYSKKVGRFLPLIKSLLNYK